MREGHLLTALHVASIDTVAEEDISLLPIKDENPDSPLALSDATMTGVSGHFFIAWGRCKSTLFIWPLFAGMRIGPVIYCRVWPE